MSPWRWESDQWDGWYLEKRKNSPKWVQTYKGKIMATYRQISIDSDENNFPVVILQDITNNFYIKLTQGIFFSGSNFKSFDQYLTGFWSSKKGKTYFLIMKKHYHEGAGKSLIQLV